MSACVGISYLIRESSRAKALRISVSSDGRVVVTKPKRVSRSLVEQIVQKRLGWIADKLNMFKELRRVSSPVSSYHESKAQALVFVRSRIEHFNTFYHHPIGRISVRNQRTRWGSCSRRGNLHFNYRIMHLPSEVADYLIVHELCHIAELNHSINFWNLVSRTIRNYKELRRLLRKTQM